MPPTSALTSATAPFAYQTLLTEQVGEHVLVVTLNRPQVRNALNTQMWHELLDLWTRLGAEPGGQPSDEMARFVDTEIRKWAKVVKDSGAKLD